MAIDIGEAVIRIQTKLGTQGGSQFQNEMKKTAKVIKDSDKSIKKLEDRLDSLKKKSRGLDLHSRGYAKVNKEIGRTERELGRLHRRERLLQRSGIIGSVARFGGGRGADFLSHISGVGQSLGIFGAVIAAGTAGIAAGQGVLGKVGQGASTIRNLKQQQNLNRVLGADRLDFDFLGEGSRAQARGQFGAFGRTGKGTRKAITEGVRKVGAGGLQAILNQSPNLLAKQAGISLEEAFHFRHAAQQLQAGTPGAEAFERGFTATLNKILRGVRSPINEQKLERGLEKERIRKEREHIEPFIGKKGLKNFNELVSTTGKVNTALFAMQRSIASMTSAIVGAITEIRSYVSKSDEEEKLKNRPNQGKTKRGG